MPLCAFVELEGGRSAWTDGRSAAQRCCLVLRAAPWKGSAFRAGTCSLPRPSLPTGKTQGTVLAEFLRQAGPASPRVVCAVVPLCPVALDCASSRKEVGKEGRPLSVTHAPAPEVGLLSQPPWGALGSRGGALMCGRICVCVCVRPATPDPAVCFCARPAPRPRGLFASVFSQLGIQHQR